MKKSTAISGSPFSSSFLIPIFFLLLSLPSNADNGWWEGARPEVKRADERKPLLKTEYGEISAVDFNDGSRFGLYHLQFITLEPNALFLPVLLHADMVFYVHTGSGSLNWVDDEDLREVDLRRGDIYRLHPGSIFYLQSSLETEREKLRIYALFSSTDDDSFDPAIGAYSSVTDLVRGFDKKVLREAFMAPEEVIEELMNATKPPLIVHAVPSRSKKSTSLRSSSSWELEARFLKAFMGGGESGMGLNKKKKKGIYNVYEADPDFENCNGWSLTVTKKVSHQLKGSNVGLFVVNLTAGSMMGPHWNTRAWEIGIVTSDEPGVVRVGCSSAALESSTCKNWSFVVGKGDVFVVPRFHPMAQMSFNNGTFVFVGFSTTNRYNMPQFFAGSSSVLQVLDRKVLAWSFDVNVTTIDRLLGARVESVILECTSCAEEEVRKMEEAERERQEEEEREREEEEKRREEEEKRKKEEEEERKREEEEKRRREEEEKRKREEEEKRREEEEERKREEEEERRREEEEKRKREEEEARKEEEERRKREEEEGEEWERREEERERREEGEEEEAERGKEEEEAKRREEAERGAEGWRRHREGEGEAAEREAEEREKRGREEEEEETETESESEQPVLRILGQWT